MVRKKRQSKRLKLKDQHKVRRKVAQHHKKLKKEYKKNPQLRKRLRKENLLVPNSWPIKQEYLKQLEKKPQSKKQVNEDDVDDEVELNNENFAGGFGEEDEEEMLHDAEEEALRKKAESFPKVQVTKKEGFRNLLTIIKNANIILEILDARDPLGTRCTELENKIKEIDPCKQIILVINKADMIPTENLQSWLSHLSTQLPTIAFQSAVQSVNYKCLGDISLLQLINNYINYKNIQDKVTVGVIGFHNVGKYSVIRSLKSVFSPDSEEPDIQLAENITLISKSGVILAASNKEPRGEAILRNVTDLKYVDEPAFPIRTIVKRCPAEQLLQLYMIPKYKNANQFLQLVASRLKRTKKEDPNITNTCRAVCEDWHSGKIPHYTEVPTTENTSDSTEWREVFDMDSVEEQVQNEVVDKASISFKKILFAVPITPISVDLHEAWKNLNRTDDDPLNDIIEDKKKNRSKKKRKINELKKKQKTEVTAEPPQKVKKQDEKYDFSKDFVYDKT